MPYSDINAENEYLRFALRSAGIGTWDLDPAKGLIRWDDRCKELYGFSKEDIVPYDEVLRYIHPEDRDRVYAAVEQALDERKGGGYDIRFRTIGADDSRLRWIYSRGQAYFRDGQAYRFSGSAQEITKEIDLEAQAEASERLAQLALESADAGWFSLTLDDDSMVYSKAFAYIMTGNETVKIDRNGFIACIHPDDRELRNEAIKSGFENGRLDYTSRVVWHDGSVHWMTVSGKYYYNKNGKAVSLHATVLDSTAEKLMQRQVEESDRKYRALVEEAPVATCLFTGPEMLVEVANEQMLQYWGKDASILGKPILEAIPELAGQPFADILQTVYNTGKPYTGYGERAELMFNGKLRTYYFDYTYKPLFDADGNVYGIMDMAVDVTEQVLSLQMLETSEQKFRSLISAAPIAIGILRGRDLVIEEPNQAYIDITGKGDVITGLPLREAMPELITEKQPFLDVLDEVFTTGETFRADGTMMKIVQDGVMTHNYYDFTYSPLYDEKGDIYGILHIVVDVTERVTATRKIEVSEARIRTMIDQAPMAIGLLRGRSLVVEMGNEGIFRLWGKSMEVVGLPIEEALPEIKGQPFPDLLRKVYDTGESVFGYDMLAKLTYDGQLTDRYFDFTYTPLRDESDKIVGIMVMAADVTDKVNARNAQEESETRARAVISLSPTPMAMLMGKELEITLSNAAMLKAWGKSEEVIGQPFLQVLPEMADQPFPAMLYSVINTGESITGNAAHARHWHNGKPVDSYYDFSYNPVKDVHGKTTGVMVISHDVTSQVRARQQITEAQNNLRNAIEVADLGTWLLHPETAEMQLSERTRVWMGLSEMVKLEQVFAAIHPKDAERIRNAITLALDPSSPGLIDEEFMVVALITGRERILHVQGQATFDDTGNAVKVYGMAQDVTAQRRIQLALQEQVKERTEQLAATNRELEQSNELLVRSNEELTQYAYVASHDLQEPLRKIRIFSSMLGKVKDMPAESMALLDRMEQSSQRMTMLIQDLLEFSRLLNADALKQPVDLNNILQEVVKDFELKVEEKDATISIKELPVLQAVRLQMNQLFYNLLGNALKFSREGVPPHIHVEAEQADSATIKQYIPNANADTKYVRITFSDNGIGFDKQYEEQVFEVFKRLHGREFYPGSGIGLALCRRIVTNHSGYMYVASELGKGTTFYIILPQDASGDTTYANTDTNIRA